MNGYGYDLTQKYEDNFRDDTDLMLNLFGKSIMMPKVIRVTLGAMALVTTRLWETTLLIILARH